MDDINPIQDLQFQLIRQVRFNLCDGARVVDDLLANRSLWRGVIMDRAVYRLRLMPGESEESDFINLIKLRDIQWGVWNVDNLYVLSSGADDDALFALAQTWSADEVYWIEGEEAGSRLGVSPTDARILSVWWD